MDFYFMLSYLFRFSQIEKKILIRSSATKLRHDIWFPVWHFDKCRRACGSAASFKAFISFTINFQWCSVSSLTKRLATALIRLCVCAGWSEALLFTHCLRNRSAPAVNCWVIIHCLEVSCKEDQIMSAQRECFIFVQLTGIGADLFRF